MKKVLITGSSGFLGHIIEEKLSLLYEIFVLNRQSKGLDSSHSIIGDLTKGVKVVLPNDIDIVIHCAGKAHSVPKNQKEKEEFYQVNVLGTSNLLKILELNNIKPEAFVLISSVAVYGLTTGIDIDENVELRALDAYGQSKILAENQVLEWGNKRGVSITVLRLPLVIGKNPLGNLKSMIEGIQKGYYFSIGDANTKKSMVLATDIANALSKGLITGGIYNLTDGYHPSFRELETAISLSLNKKKPFIMPLWIAQCVGLIGTVINSVAGSRIVPLDNSTLTKIVSPLTFSDAKARKSWGWSSHNVLDSF